MNAIKELSPQVGTAAACRSLGVPRATLYRCRRSKPPKPATTPRPTSPRALCDQERQQVLDVLHSEPFADKAPAEVYAALLDQGQYLCSIRTMYRVLDALKEVRERREPTATPNLPQAATAGHRAQSGLDLGHHQAAGAGEMDLLPSVCDPRHLQPLCRRLDAGQPRK